MHTFDSLDLTRFSDDVEVGAGALTGASAPDRVALLEYELRKARETIASLRSTLTMATEHEGLSPKVSSRKASVVEGEAVMPHERNAINFLVNEYLLSQNYKMTSVTFSEENGEQDLEDWDVVGLNRAQPPSLLQLYRMSSGGGGGGVDKALGEPKKVKRGDDVAVEVNMDVEVMAAQVARIEGLNEKQRFFLAKIDQLQADIDALKEERDVFLKKIENLWVLSIVVLVFF